MDREGHCVPGRDFSGFWLNRAEPGCAPAADDKICAAFPGIFL